jgi:hypothetical protein
MDNQFRMSRSGRVIRAPVKYVPEFFTDDEDERDYSIFDEEISSPEECKQKHSKLQEVIQKYGVDSKQARIIEKIEKYDDDSDYVLDSTDDEDDDEDISCTDDDDDISCTDEEDISCTDDDDDIIDSDIDDIEESDESDLYSETDEN